jgi:hypothetical protein
MASNYDIYSTPLKEFQSKRDKTFFEIYGKPSFVVKLFYESYAVFLPSLLSISTKN